MKRLAGRAAAPPSVVDEEEGPALAVYFIKLRNRKRAAELVPLETGHGTAVAILERIVGIQLRVAEEPIRSCKYEQACCFERRLETIGQTPAMCKKRAMRKKKWFRQFQLCYIILSTTSHALG